MFSIKKIFVKTLGFGFLGLVVMLSACGGGGSGGSSGGGGGSGAKNLTTGTFTKSYAPTAIGSDKVPFTSGFDIKQQMLYLSSDINGAGYITSLRFSRGSGITADVTCPDTVIKLSQTSVTTLTTDYAGNLNTGKGVQNVVFGSATLTITAGAAGTWFNVPLTTPFYYNGVDNLVVEIKHYSGCSADAGMQFVSSTGGNRRAASFSPDATPGASDLGATETTAYAADTQQMLMQFGFSGGDNKIDYGAKTSNAAPLSTTTNYQKVQMLYGASVINGSGPITGIGFQVYNAVTAAQTYTYTIRLGHTSLSDLTTDWNTNMNVGSPVTVANSRTVTIPAGIPAGGYVWFPVPDGVFNYNGSDNLVVEVTIESATGDVGLSAHATTGQAFAYGSGASTTASGNAAYADQIALRFYGGKIGVVTDDSGTTSAMLNAIAAGRMNLYRASELGTAATITSVSCRMSDATSTASTLSNYKVIMGHTTLDSLDVVSVNNFVSQKVVFNGNLDIPAGLVQGDWITINLTTPFAYNGTDNLVVWMGTTSGSASATTHSCFLSSADGVRYPGHTGTAVPDNTAVTNIYNSKTDIQLGISKTQ